MLNSINSPLSELAIYRPSEFL